MNDLIKKNILSFFSIAILMIITVSLIGYFFLQLTPYYNLLLTGEKKEINIPNKENENIEYYFYQPPTFVMLGVVKSPGDCYIKFKDKSEFSFNCEISRQPFLYYPKTKEFYYFEDTTLKDKSLFDELAIARVNHILSIYIIDKQVKQLKELEAIRDRTILPKSEQVLKFDDLKDNQLKCTIGNEDYICTFSDLDKERIKLIKIEKMNDSYA